MNAVNSNPHRFRSDMFRFLPSPVRKAETQLEPHGESVEIQEIDAN